MPILRCRVSHRPKALIAPSAGLLYYLTSARRRQVQVQQRFSEVNVRESSVSHFCPSISPQDVFLMIRRHKTTIFTDAKESTTVYELKRIVEGVLKRPPEDQKLYKDDVMLNDGQTLGNCGFTNQTARPQTPATVGLSFRLSDDSYEQLRVESFSTPPELPDVMKPQDSGSTANEQSVQ
ncbi:elongin-B [Pseudoliparis swirei]|uniref:elongin-B n=1 Tax=Pseudoliparis swirei TaxID=2059687 RepID=UPI0024BE5E3F|nr:elongin-B [Pseudoliparis swirei]